MAGLYFEEFEIGREFHHEFSRTVTEMDNTMFSLMTMNPQPLHIDARVDDEIKSLAAKWTPYGFRNFHISSNNVHPNFPMSSAGSISSFELGHGRHFQVPGAAQAP